MEWTYAINKAIAYMEENIHKDISLADIAASVNISPFHFQRAFSIIAGMTPAEYMRKRRLSLAGSALAAGSVKVIDIALQYGYDSPESFSKAFSRFHGATPLQAKNGHSLHYFHRLSLKIIMEGGSTMKYTIEKWDAMDLLVHTKKFSSETGEHEIPKFWEAYFANENYYKVPGYLGVCVQKKTDGSDFLYGIGCNASDAEEILEGFEILHIPEYEWVVFQCVGPTPDAVQKAWDQIYREWLPVSDFEIVQEYQIENYLPGDPSAADYVSEICIPVKRRKMAL